MAHLLSDWKGVDHTKIQRLEFPDAELVARLSEADMKVRHIDLVFEIRSSTFAAAQETRGKYVDDNGAICGFLDVRITAPNSIPDLGGITISAPAPRE